MPYEPKPGDVSAWKGEGGGKPSVKGTLTAHRTIKAGETIEWAIWGNKYKDTESKPDFTGKCQDKWVPPQRTGRQSREDYMQERSGANAPQPAAEFATDFDDEIPF